MVRPLVALVGVVTMVAIGAGAGELDRLPLGPPELAYSTGSARAGQLYDVRAGKVISEAEALDRLAEARVILLGEEHTAIEQKQLQARLVDGLADRLSTLVLGMEFFHRGDDAVLARWTSGELSGDPFLLASGWYDRGGYNWVYYAPVMDEARRRGLRVVGLNVPREIPRAVSRGGLEALSPEQRAEVGDIQTAGSPQHRYLISRFFGDSVALMPGAWFDRMYAAQCLWDVVMARSILAKLPTDGAMVVVVGSGHVAYGLGIARRIHEELARRGEPDIRVATL
ncbi:MAG: ChaN family lipoprotein, partial [Acidobacteria bacterium]|nr:ChaN family lipoprotein [Acidobacteriota bacterium]